MSLSRLLLIAICWKKTHGQFVTENQLKFLFIYTQRTCKISLRNFWLWQYSNNTQARWPRGALASSPSGRGSFQFLHRVQCFVTVVPVRCIVTVLAAFGSFFSNKRSVLLSRTDNALTDLSCSCHWQTQSYFVGLNMSNVPHQQGGICRGGGARELPPHWIWPSLPLVRKGCRGNGNGEGREREGWGAHLPYTPRTCTEVSGVENIGQCVRLSQLSWLCGAV